MSFFFGTAVSSCFFFQLESHFERRPSEFGFIGLFLFSLKKSFFYFKIFRNKRNEIVNVPRRQSCVISRFIFYIFYIFFLASEVPKETRFGDFVENKKKKKLFLPSSRLLEPFKDKSPSWIMLIHFESQLPHRGNKKERERFFFVF